MIWPKWPLMPQASEPEVPDMTLGASSVPPPLSNYHVRGSTRKAKVLNDTLENSEGHVPTLAKGTDGFGDPQGQCGVCECGCVCSYIAVSLIHLANANVIVHGYLVKSTWLFYVNDLMTNK